MMRGVIAIAILVILVVGFNSCKKKKEGLHPNSRDVIATCEFYCWIIKANSPRIVIHIR
jgi:hypothetical protein